MDGHDINCHVWDWISGDKLLNNAKPCTCGYRELVEAEKLTRQAGYRATRPLGMSEDDWLRTLGIDPN